MAIKWLKWSLEWLPPLALFNKPVISCAFHLNKQTDLLSEGANVESHNYDTTTKRSEVDSNRKLQ